MKTHLALDKAGRVVLPKPLRERLRLGPGDELEIRCANDALTLRPIRHTMPLAKERGIWVYRTGQRADLAAIDRLIAELREERSRDVLRSWHR